MFTLMELEEKLDGTEIVFEEIMSEPPPPKISDRHTLTYIRSWISNRINPKKSTVRHIIIKFVKTKHKNS